MDTRTHARPVVLITGGSRGIGAAAARRFAQGGWDVAINYRRSRQAAEDLVQELARWGPGRWRWQRPFCCQHRTRSRIWESPLPFPFSS